MEQKVAQFAPKVAHKVAKTESITEVFTFKKAPKVIRLL